MVAVNDNVGSLKIAKFGSNMSFDTWMHSLAAVASNSFERLVTNPDVAFVNPVPAMEEIDLVNEHASDPIAWCFHHPLFFEDRLIGGVNRKDKNHTIENEWVCRFVWKIFVNHIEHRSFNACH